MPKVQKKKPVGRPKKRSMIGTASMTNPGRPPKKDIGNASYSTKLRRAHELAGKFDIETIQLALNLAKRNEVDETDERADSAEHLPIRHTNESGFAFFLENDYSKAQWERLVADSKKRGANIYPSFYLLGHVKEQCRPQVFTIQNEVCIEVELQVMMNLTAERLVRAVGVNWSQYDLNRLTLIGAYGFDSSSGFKNPHQKFEDKANVSLKSEFSLFASTFAISGLVTSNKKNMWLNPTPQSVRFCTPLRIALEKETEATVTAERDRLETQVKSLKSHRFPVTNEKQATVKFDLYFSMVDGKCLNFLLENDATTRCPICTLTMGNFNKPVDWETVVPKEHLKHGLGNLHCEIKTMEMLIKLSCRHRLGLQKWTVSGEHKHDASLILDDIKDKLFEAFSVRVDEVQHGSGTSLTGNIARKCLSDPEKLATALQIDSELVERLWYVLLAFRQKDGIDLQKLQCYCTETYKMYFDLYKWAKMNPSVHKLLRHGPAIANEFPLSLAYFAEDSAESMHKYYRKNSLAHARQSSREHRLLDVYNRSVDLSDPAISLVYLDDRKKSSAKNSLLIFGHYS